MIAFEEIPHSFTWASGSSHSIGVAGSGPWGQSYGYDGFGNLTDQTLIKGTGPDVHVSVNPANNRLSSDSYDANGNDVTIGTAYDVENRLVSAAGAQYRYDLNGRRVWKAPDGNQSDEEFYFWAPNGQRLGTYKSTSPGTNGFTTASTNAYFAGRLIQAAGGAMLADRIGSNVSGGKRYFPYGQERPSATTNNIEKFTGYFRDLETGLDYAQARYQAPGMGRFITPDPAGAGSNWYQYAETRSTTSIPPVLSSYLLRILRPGRKQNTVGKRAA